MECIYIKKRNKPDVSEGVTQEAVNAVKESRLSLRDGTTRYRMTYSGYFNCTGIT
jgi:hypothetical protein